MSPNDAERMANSVDPDQTLYESTLYVQTCVSKRHDYKSMMFKKNFSWSVDCSRLLLCEKMSSQQQLR